METRILELFLNQGLLFSYREMVNEDLLASVLICKPEFPVRPEEEVDRRMSREGVERCLSEASDHGTFPLDGYHLGEQALAAVHGRMVNLDGRGGNKRKEE